MSHTKKNDTNINFQLRGLELLNHAITIPNNVDVTKINPTYNISIEIKSNNEAQLLFVIVNVQISDLPLKIQLGSISVSCIYHIANYNEIVQTDKSGTLQLQQEMLVLLNSISISTTRGVMFGVFKGTLLHNAILPLIDPKL